MGIKDVHTAHCCILHGCKYGNRDRDCTVFTHGETQDGPCQICVEYLDEDIESALSTVEVLKFLAKHEDWYRSADAKRALHALRQAQIRTKISP